jgi:peptide-methionine (S)-S-oxide reductase
MARSETATLAGGCFWCLEAVYQEMEGVLQVESGYAGGPIPNPTYEEVCSGSTGHAEAVQVRFDPDVTSYRDILEVFFAIHDPTTPDRQGNDIGTQYRSAIFWHDEQQRATAEKLIRELDSEKIWPSPIVTELLPAGDFYRAEQYHQNYFQDHRLQPYCAFTVAPKIRKFREKFATKVRERT